MALLRNDLQLKASYGSSPPCTQLIFIKHMLLCIVLQIHFIICDMDKSNFRYASNKHHFREKGLSAVWYTVWNVSIYMQHTATHCSTLQQPRISVWYTVWNVSNSYPWIKHTSIIIFDMDTFSFWCVPNKSHSAEKGFRQNDYFWHVSNFWDVSNLAITCPSIFWICI